MHRAHTKLTDPEAMADILARTNVGRLATIDADGYPYITPVNFVFYQGRIYFHCAKKGEKLDNLARNSKVCFQADVTLSYLDAALVPDKNACNVHQLFQSVVIRGTASVLPDGDLKTETLNALVAKHEEGREFKPVAPDNPNYKACEVVEVIPDTMTGKADLLQKKSEEERRRVADYLLKRAWPADRATAEALGFEIQDGPEGPVLK